MEIRDRIKKILELKNWSVYKLSKESKVAQSTLSDILSGKNKNPNFDTLNKIADALEVSVDRLTGESASSIIENRLEEIGMTIEELAKKSKVPVSFIENLDNLVPDFEVDGGEHCYVYMSSIAWCLGLPGSTLRAAFARQESPAYDGPISSVEEDFSDIFVDVGHDDSPKNQISNLTKKETTLLINFNKLNDIGQHEASKRVEELTYIDKYKIEKDYLLLDAAHEIKGSSEEDKKHDDDIMDDDNF